MGSQPVLVERGSKGDPRFSGRGSVLTGNYRFFLRNGVVIANRATLAHCGGIAPQRARHLHQQSPLQKYTEQISQVIEALDGQAPKITYAPRGGSGK